MSVSADCLEIELENFVFSKNNLETILNFTYHHPYQTFKDALKLAVFIHEKYSYVLEVSSSNN